MPFEPRKINTILPVSEAFKVHLCVSEQQCFITAGLESDDGLWYPAIAQKVGNEWKVTSNGRKGYATGLEAKMELGKTLQHLAVWIEGDVYEYPFLKGRIRVTQPLTVDIFGRITRQQKREIRDKFQKKLLKLKKSKNRVAEDIERIETVSHKPDMSRRDYPPMTYLESMEQLEETE